MAKSKLAQMNQKIEKTVVEGYREIEDTVVGGYKKIEDTVVGGFNKLSDKFVDQFLTRDGETVEEARQRMADEQAAREAAQKEAAEKRAAEQAERLEKIRAQVNVPTHGDPSQDERRP